MLLEEAVYTPAGKARIIELLDVLGLTRSDSAKFAVLRLIRGQLLRRPRAGGVGVTAAGRGHWIGWVELRTDRVDEVALATPAG